MRRIVPISFGLLLCGIAVFLRVCSPAEEGQTPAGERAALLLQQLAESPGNEKFIIDRLDGREAFPERPEQDHDVFLYIRVLDPDGNPVSGLACATNSYDFFTGSYTTDAEGFCRAKVPGWGEVGVKLYDRYAAVSQRAMWRVTRLPGAKDAVLTLRWEGSLPAEIIEACPNRLTITVVDENGTPVGNAPIWWIHPSLYKGAACVMPAPADLTDTDGRLVMTDVSPSLRRLRVTTNPYALTPSSTTGGGYREMLYLGGTKEITVPLPDR